MNKSHFFSLSENSPIPYKNVFQRRSFDTSPTHMLNPIYGVEYGIFYFTVNNAFNYKINRNILLCLIPPHNF